MIDPLHHYGNDLDTIITMEIHSLSAISYAFFTTFVQGTQCIIHSKYMIRIPIITSLLHIITMAVIAYYQKVIIKLLLPHMQKYT